MNGIHAGRGTIGVSLALLASPLASGQETIRASVDSAGVEADLGGYSPSLSADGRFVAFLSDATNLVPGDTNGKVDIFVRDRLLATTTRVSVDSSGIEGNGHSGGPSISADGRLVAFDSQASNLVANDTNLAADVFVFDRLTRITTRVSVDSTGQEGDGISLFPAISADGRFVAFMSYARTLVAGDTNLATDVFVHDRQTATTTRVSVDSTGGEANGASEHASISADGTLVAFDSLATDLVPGDGNGTYDGFVHDRSTGVTERVSVDSTGAEGNGPSFDSAISEDGRIVAFRSYASNLVAGDTNAFDDIFVHDRSTGITERVSVDSAGGEVHDSNFDPDLSADGRFVSFTSFSSDLVPGDTNPWTDIFVHDRQTAATTLVSVSSSGAASNSISDYSDLSADGRFMAFQSFASTLVPGDRNHSTDAFVHGPYLTLEADPAVVAAGATITLTTWTGQPSGLGVLAVVEVNGTPAFLVAAIDLFDPSGAWAFSATVPPGLSGYVFALQSFGFVVTGRAAASNLEPVTFQ